MTVVTTPSAGDHGFAYNSWPWQDDLAANGYREDEYFLSGTAQTYDLDRPSAPFTTRFQVFRPVDPQRFSGTAIVEWNNVTAQGDIPIEWNWAHRWAMRNGHVFVTASVQQVSACGMSIPDIVDINNHPPVLPVCSPLSLKAWDPQRYNAIEHPGDDYSYDIFSKIADAVRTRSESVVGGLDVRHVLAAGESQSAQQLGVYLCNGADRDAQAIDGALIDADWGRYLTCNPRIPTLRLWSEESMTASRATESPTLRVWMAAGAPHVDSWQLAFIAETLRHNLTGDIAADYSEIRSRALNFGQDGVPSVTAATCVSGDQYPRYTIVDSALQALHDWVAHGVLPTPMPSITFSATLNLNEIAPLLTLPNALARDRFGNALGGIRSPVLDVPVATYTGSACGPTGQTVALPPDFTSVMYPTHADYVAKFAEATDSSVSSGYLLAEDANELLRAACASAIGGSDTVPCPRVE